MKVRSEGKEEQCKETKNKNNNIFDVKNFFGVKTAFDVKHFFDVKNLFDVNKHV